MKRRTHCGTVFATLLVWQVALALTSQRAAFATMPGDGVSAMSAHCRVAHASTVQGASPSMVGSAFLSDSSGAKGKPACCAVDACKCGAALGALAMTSAGPRPFTAAQSPPPSVSDAPPIAARAASPFRPPI